MLHLGDILLFAKMIWDYEVDEKLNPQSANQIDAGLTRLSVSRPGITSSALVSAAGSSKRIL